MFKQHSLLVAIATVGMIGFASAQSKLDVSTPELDWSIDGPVNAENVVLEATATDHKLRAEYGSAADAKAMLDRAMAELTTNKQGAIDKFNHNDKRFRDRDLFVFCFNALDGKFTAHEAMVGQHVRFFNDSAGKPLGAEMRSAARQGEITEVAFVSPLPGSTKLVEKRSYVTQIDGEICGVNFYWVENGSNAPKS